MAAALLGHAARRLPGWAASGVLRQTQESAVKRRFAHTEVQHHCTCGKFERDAVMNQLQKHKEDLYDAVTAVNKTYPSVKNGALLREHSDHVKTAAPTPPAQVKHKLVHATGVATMVAGSFYLSRKMLEAVFG